MSTLKMISELQYVYIVLCNSEIDFDVRCSHLKLRWIPDWICLVMYFNTRWKFTASVWETTIAAWTSRLDLIQVDPTLTSTLKREAEAMNCENNFRVALCRQFQNCTTYVDIVQL